MAPPSQNSNEERTEPATPHRREEFRRRGTVALSREVSSVALLLAVGAALWLAIHYMFKEFSHLSQSFLSFSSIQTLTESELYDLIQLGFMSWGKIVAPVFVVAFVIGVAACIAQVGFVVSWEPLSPNWDRINPVNGFQRLFSSKGSMEAVKALLKVCLCAIVVAVFCKNQAEVVGQYYEGDLPEVVTKILIAVGKLFFTIVACFVIVAGLDYGFQRFQLEKQMRMTRTEAKEEFKLREGDPMVKARIRNVQRKIANQRMMEAVPKADVVVTNPTHFAVALQYNGEAMHAPKVVAKGADLVAQKIKEVARFHHIPIVENKPLARTLFKKIEIGHFIPKELYKAVAEVLAYVYRLRDNLKAAGVYG